MTARLGVLYQGSPDVTLGTSSMDPRAREDIAEEQRKLQNKLDKYKFYPIVGVGLAYKF